MEWSREHATRKPPSMSCKERLVRRAIDELKGGTKGSSDSAIKKQMQGGYSSRKWSNVSFLKALKSGVQCGDFIQTKQSYKLSAAINRKPDAAKHVEDLGKKQTECVGLLMECVDEAKKEPLVAALGASLRALHLNTRFLAISIRDSVCCAGDVRECCR
jgi:hypothetical protein